MLIYFVIMNEIYGFEEVTEAISCFMKVAQLGVIFNLYTSTLNMSFIHTYFQIIELVWLCLK